MSTELTEAAAEIATPTNPFPGLRPFEFEESHLFFGRDGQSEQLISKLGRTRFLAVVGTSGSGKSSLVRAGFLPALLGGFMTSAGSGWRVAIMRPGNDPIGNLAQALNGPDVFGSEIEENAAVQIAIAEATLRRGSLGLVDAVRQATMPENENLIVVVDQFEEIFRFARVAEGEAYRNEAAAFVKLILEATSQREIPIYVVLTMRSDYLGDCSQFWDLPEAINESQYLIPRLTRDQLREAITGPVAVGSSKITPRLVNRLLNNVGDSQDQLPVLQHLLMRAWSECREMRLEVGTDDGVRRPHKEVHEGEAMDLCCSEAVGGMDRALSRHADEAFNELPDDTHREVAEKVFKALTEKGPDNREIRRPIMLSEVCAITAATPAVVSTIIETFRQPGRSFLMPPAQVELNSESLIDISHESLIRGWMRLKEWVEEEARSARIYKRVADAAMLHKAGEEALINDPALQTALDWRDKNKPNAAWARRYHPEFEEAMNYLAASVAARDAEAREREQQHRKDVSFKRTRVAASLLLVSLLLSVIASVYAYNKLDSAKDALAEDRVALAQAEVARKQAEVARKEAEVQLGEARIQSSLASEVAQLANRDAKMAQDAQAEASRSMMYARQNLALAERQNAIAQNALAQAEEQRNLAADDALKNRQLFYSADINLAQQAYEAGRVERARDLLSDHPPAPGKTPFEWHYLSHLLQSEMETLEPPDKGLRTVITSYDGKTVAVGVGAAVELRGTTAGDTTRTTIRLPEGFSIGSLAFSRDGKVLAVGDATGGGESTVLLYDIKSLKSVGSLPDVSGSANALVFTRDRKTLIVGGGNGEVGLWDISSSPRKLLGTELQGTINIAVSPYGQMAAFTSADSEKNSFPIVLWDLATNQKVGELVGHGDTVTSVAFSATGKSLASGSFDRTVRIWDVEHRQQQASVPFTSKVFSVAYSPDDHFLAIGYEDGGIKLLDTTKKEVSATLRGHQEAITSLAFSAGGQLLFSCDNKLSYGADTSFTFDAEAGNTTIKSWDLATLIREQTPVPNVGNGRIRTLAYAERGKTLAVVGGANDVVLLDAETDKPLRKFHIGSSDSGQAALSPDGRRTRVGRSRSSYDPGLFALSADSRLSATAVGKTATLWNSVSNNQIGEPLKHEQNILSIGLSPDGERLATVDSGGLKFWDTGSQALVNELSNRDRSFLGLAFSGDGKYIALAYGDVVEFWDYRLANKLGQTEIPASGKKDASSEDKNRSVRPVAFSPDGADFAIIDDEGRVILIETKGFKVRATPKTGAIYSLAFSPDGKLFATGGVEGTVKLWDTVSLRELLTLGGDASPIVSVAFSPDGTKLAAADLSSLRVWRAPVPNDAVKTKGPGENK